MRLQNRFTVPVTPDDAFTALLDLERVAPCMPGAELTGRDGDDFHGRLKLRIGPITAAYQGTVTVEESDAQARRARLSASGREIGGQGGASAEVVATVSADGDGRSEVEVITDLDVRGKAAQFGRGALGEVTQRVLDQFARNLEASLTSGPRTAAPATAAPATGDAPPVAAAAPAEDLDVLRAVAGPLLARVVPVVAGLVTGFVLGRLTRRPAPPVQPMWGPPPPWWAPPQG